MAADYKGPLDGMAWAATTMEALQTKLEISTDNIANTDVNGFQRHFADIRMTDKGLVVHSQLDLAASGFRVTNRDYDFAFAGKGDFQIAPLGGSERPDPSLIKKTRYGRFFRDTEGHLTDGHGNALIASDGKFVKIKNTAKIDQSGAFAGPAGFPEAKIDVPPGSKIYPKRLEASNENAITEMVHVLDAQRAFESAEKIMSAIDSNKSQVNNAGALR